MNSIIERLYETHLKMEDLPFGTPDHEEEREEWELYLQLTKHLPEEHKEDFSRYIELRGNRQNREMKAVYDYGFKTAIKLMIEALKE